MFVSLRRVTISSVRAYSKSSIAAAATQKNPVVYFDIDIADKFAGIVMQYTLINSNFGISRENYFSTLCRPSAKDGIIFSISDGILFILVSNYFRLRISELSVLARRVLGTKDLVYIESFPSLCSKVAI